MPFLLLGLSVVLSTGRNLFSKNLSDIRFGTKPFFLCQCALFLCGSAALVLFGKISFGVVAYQTLIYAAVYAILLIFAQWFYTAALAKGNTATRQDTARHLRDFSRDTSTDKCHRVLRPYRPSSRQ